MQHIEICDILVAQCSGEIYGKNGQIRKTKRPGTKTKEIYVLFLEKNKKCKVNMKRTGGRKYGLR